MKLLISPFIIILLSSSALFGAVIDQTALRDRNVQLVSSTTESVVLRSELTGLKTEISEVNGQQYSAITLPGEPTTCYLGRPVLPMVSRFVVVSPTSNLELVVQAPEPRRVQAAAPPLLYEAEPDMSIESHDADGVFPPVVAEMGAPFIIRGVRMVKVTVFPVRYDSHSNEYLIYDGLETEVRSIGGEAVNPVTHPVRRNRSQTFLKFLDALAINGADVGRDDPERDDADRPAGHYLVVTHESCLQYIRPFIEWRRKSGYQVDILSLPSGDAGNSGTVKNGIQDRYDAYLEAGIDPFDEILLVGDRSSYYYGQQVQWVLEAENGVTNWGGARHADYLYACLEGDDELPDVGFARWISGTQQTLELAVGRTLGYEAAPNMENTAWFGHAAAFSQHWGNAAEYEWHPSIHMTARWGAELLKQKGFEDVSFYEQFQWDRSAEQIGPWLRDRVNERTNVMIGPTSVRDYWGQNFQGVNDNTVFPIFFTVGNHGDAAASAMFRTGDRAHLKGMVAMCFTVGELGYRESTLSNNVIWLEMVRAFLADDLSLGWARTMALLQFENDLPNFQANGYNVYPMYKTDFDVIGDPGLQPWIGVPRLVEAELLTPTEPNRRLFEALVTDTAGNPVSGATVTFYAPGTLPAPNNPANYANYNGYVSQSTLSDEEGHAQFLFDIGQEFITDSPLCVTVTGRDIRPFFLERQFAVPAAAIEVSNFTLQETEGNNDGEPNPGETLGITLTAKNTGQNGLAGVTATITSASLWVEVVGENGIEFGAMEAGDEFEANRAVSVRLHPSCPDGNLHPESKPVLMVEFTYEGGSSNSAIQLDPVAPKLVVNQIIDSDVIGLDQTEIDIELENVGGMGISGFVAELVALEYGISVTQEFSEYPAIQVGETSTVDSDPFVVVGNALAVPGTRVEMALIISSEGGFIDTAYFELQVRSPREHAPQGPDDYGYICFDDTDSDWEIAPEYEWIEINPDAEDRAFNGESLDFEGRSELDIGEARVIPLGFQTQFYGGLFDSITVATNGFIAIGSQPGIVNFQNWPLDRGIGGGAGMIAPLWTDLRMDRNSAVFVYRDDELSRMIIEWSNMRTTSGDLTLTFQVVLFDHAVWITESGDQEILIQYQDAEIIRNIRNGDQEWTSAVPFPSVGISSPDGRTGISYAWNNEYPVTSAPIEDGRALLFSTSLRYLSCTLYGWVRDAETRQPIEGAHVVTQHGFVAVTDAEGNWEIPNALADIDFDITAGKQGYIDSTCADLNVLENEEFEIDFSLLHPEFTPSSDRLETSLDPDATEDVPFSLFNGGNGVLTWSAEKRLLGDANAEPWENRRTFNAGVTVGDDRVQGVAFANDHFYLAGANGADSSLIYILDRNGALQDSFYQVGTSRYGYKDLDWDGELLWGATEDSVYGFTTEGEVVHRWDAPYHPTTCIAWDSERNLLLLSGTATNILACDVEGNVVGNPLSRQGFRIYGLAYWPEDPDGYSLYILNQPAPPISVLHKMNIDTGDTLRVHAFDMIEGETQMTGAYITNAWDVYSWALITIDNVATINGGDRLRIIQVDARKDWFDLDSWSGILAPGSTHNFMLELNTAGLPDTTFEGELRFTHNATEGTTNIGVSLRVIGPLPPSSFDLVEPADLDTLLMHGDINRFSPVQFFWNSSVDPNQADSLVTYVHWLQYGDSIVHYPEADTSLIIDLDTLGLLPAGFNLDGFLSWWVEAISGDDTTESSQRFRLSFAHIPGVEEDDLVPVEFGLTSLYPSPFNSSTSIQFGVDRSVTTTLRAYDVQGRLAAILYEGTPSLGYHQLTWDAGKLASGVYVVRLESAGRRSVRKIALVR